MIACARMLLSKHGWLFLLLLGLSGWPSPASAMTGNEWRALPIAARTTYVTGVVDNLVDFGAAVRSLVPAEKRIGEREDARGQFKPHTAMATALPGTSENQVFRRPWRPGNGF